METHMNPLEIRWGPTVTPKESAGILGNPYGSLGTLRNIDIQQREQYPKGTFDRYSIGARRNP